MDLTGSRENGKAAPSQVRVCRLFCSLAVIELLCAAPSSFSRVSPRPPARVTQCSVTASGLSQKETAAWQAEPWGRKEVHPAPGFRRPRKPLSEKQKRQDAHSSHSSPRIHPSIESCREAGRAGQGRCPPRTAPQRLPGSASQLHPLEAGLIIGRWKSSLSAAIENASGCWKGQREQWGPGLNPAHARQESLRVTTPDPRGWNALRRDNIFLCNHGC